MLRTVNPKDCKNLMFDGLSSFLMMQLERVLLSGDVTDHVKNSLFFCVRSASIRASHARVIVVAVAHVNNLMVISSPKIEQSSVLIDDVYRYP